MKRKRKSKRSGWNPWPTFMVWCPEAQRFEALTSALIALAGEDGVCLVSAYERDAPDHFLPPRKAVEVIRPDYERCGNQSAYINDFRASSGRVLQLNASTNRDRYFSDFPGHPSLFVSFLSEPFVEGQLLPPTIVRFKGISTPLEFDAGVAWFIAMNDMLHILKPFCTSHPAITMGCCLEGPIWGAPLTGAASYHADGSPGRDLALSWIHLHDKDPLESGRGLVH